MVLKVKSLDASTTKWSENASRAAQAYADGAAAAGEQWASKTTAGADNYKAAITAAGIADRFKAGVRKAGAAKYVRKILDVAKDRFAPGVAAAVTDYRAGFEPYNATLQALTLSPRKPRGDISNYQRNVEVGKALNAKRLALLGMTSAK